MKKISLYLILIFSLSCLSRTATRLEEQPLKVFENNHSNLTITIKERKDAKIYVDLYIQDSDSFEKNPTQFLPTYYFSDSFKSDRIKFSVPQGKFVGFLNIWSKDSIPFYRTIHGGHNVYFGINKEYKKTTDFSKGCTQIKFFDTDLDRISTKTQCNYFETNKKDLFLEFSISDKNQINELRTLLLLWPSFSYAALHGPQPYPYAVLLILQGLFGFTVRDTTINFDNYDNF
ncbi:hypothetical protein EHR01_12255 [Leptospira mtsangambouensis]|uniref:Lipoprotein n=1 Tax=Leptospira mtsangambouensis TaxID=2484912 RepID=A0ABY2NYQ3_9LEPT|nr:hypothetical protein [Leptospira mtsangambouensis]TGM74268.1 hypothetical protein EHR01_12255 [Leptospira mtsangambouensis]